MGKDLERDLGFQDLLEEFVWRAFKAQEHRHEIYWELVGLHLWRCAKQLLDNHERSGKPLLR